MSDFFKMAVTLGGAAFAVYLFFRLGSMAVFKSWLEILGPERCKRCLYYNLCKEANYGKEREERQEKEKGKGTEQASLSK